MSLEALTFLSVEKASLIISIGSPVNIVKLFAIAGTYFMYDPDLISAEESYALFRELWTDHLDKIVQANVPSTSTYDNLCTAYGWTFLYHDRAYHIRFVYQPTRNQVQQVLLYQQIDTTQDGETDRQVVINLLRPNLDAAFFQKLQSYKQNPPNTAL